VWFELLLIGLFADGCLIVRTGLEGPGLTKSQKLWYCLAMVGGRYSWGRLQLISAFHRWGDQERSSWACRAWRLLQRAESVYKIACFVNLLFFLRSGRYVFLNCCNPVCFWFPHAFFFHWFSFTLQTDFLIINFPDIPA
jgi:hypothetical protein